MHWMALVSLASVVAGDPDCPYGVNAHQASSVALDQAAAADISWVRFDMNWWQFEPARDDYQWALADAFIDHADAAGLSVFVTIAYTPPWASSVPCNDADPNEANWCRNAPPQVSDWVDFVTAAVTRYGDRVEHWGLWNEPNLGHFYRGTRPQWVAEVLLPGSDAVHSACPTCSVLGPELANLSLASWDADEGTCAFGECTFNGWNHSLIQILDVAGDAIDIVTHHKYHDPTDEFWASASDGDFLFIQTKNGIKEITDQYAPGKAVWLTEFGWESEPFGPHSNDYAAAQLTALFEGFAQVRAGTHPLVTNQPWPELDKLFWYDLHDDPSGYSWGLLTSDLQPKPPYDAYAAVVADLGCELGDDGGSTDDGGMETGSETASTGSDGATAGDAGPTAGGGSQDDGASGGGASGAESGSGGIGSPGVGDGTPGSCACRVNGGPAAPLSFLLAWVAVAVASRRRPDPKLA